MARHQVLSFEAGKRDSGMEDVQRGAQSVEQRLPCLGESKGSVILHLHSVTFRPVAPALHQPQLLLGKSRGIFHAFPLVCPTFFPPTERKHTAVLSGIRLTQDCQEESFTWRTVRENVAYGMEVKGVGKEEREARATKIMDLVGLTSCADLYPNQVSASMMQRIAVSRAFAVNPDLLLMDEPYGQLDVKLRFYLEDELVNIWRKLNSTVLFVTHNIEEAVYVAERILVLTNKPTKIKAEIPVDLPRPRDLLNPKFIELRKEVTELIRWW